MMMLFKSILLFVFAYTVSSKHVGVKDEDYPSLRWPSVYTVEATKLYLSSGWTEHFKYWRSSCYSRLDANSGAVTKLTGPGIENDYGTEYEIHPETTEEKSNEMVCYKMEGSCDQKVESLPFLPDTEYYEKEGNDTVKSLDCVKFTYSDDEDDGHAEETLWAYYDESTEAWIPVRYEKQSHNTRHGYLGGHVITDYFNFQADVDLEEFEIYKRHDCQTMIYEDNADDILKSYTDKLQAMKDEEKRELDEAFDKYKRQFRKRYANQAEYEKRKGIFYDNWRLVTDTNRRNQSYKLALNKMSDRTKLEMKKYKGLRRDKPRSVRKVRFPYNEEEIEVLSKTLPTQYDLRLQGVVGPVLNQEDCGSCWTFGTTAAVEGALARSNGNELISLSNQALLDCSWGFGNSGCNGGVDDSAYEWVMKYGLPTIQEYGPYMKQDGFCNIENMTTTYKIREFINVTPNNEKALKIAIIKHGPLSVSIDASDALMQYDGGIFYDPSCKSSPESMNHEVTLVGYGEKDGESFWIIKNSWGPYWGLDGYIHISTKNNNCGVMTEPTIHTPPLTKIKILYKRPFSCRVYTSTSAKYLLLKSARSESQLGLKKKFG